jgi:hypothetical protein
MMNIQVGENYRIESDKYNYILKNRKVSDPTHRFSKGIAKETWEDVGYFSKLEHLVHRLIELEVKTSDTTNLLDVVRVINEIATFKVSEIKNLKEKGNE